MYMYIYINIYIYSYIYIYVLVCVRYILRETARHAGCDSEGGRDRAHFQAKRRVRGIRITSPLFEVKHRVFKM